jgi:hypothetical protein
MNIPCLSQNDWIGLGLSRRLLRQHRPLKNNRLSNSSPMQTLEQQRRIGALSAKQTPMQSAAKGRSPPNLTVVAMLKAARVGWFRTENYSRTPDLNAIFYFVCTTLLRCSA